MSNLKIKVNSKKGLVRDIHISVPSNVIEEKRNTRFSQLSKTAKLPGFRPGKVPEKVIRRQYADQVLQEVLSDVLETTYMESIQEKNLQPAGPPKVALDEYVKETIKSRKHKIVKINSSSLVNLVETGKFIDEPEYCSTIIQKILKKKFQQNKIDVATLSSTHLPFLLPLLKDAFPNVRFLDPAITVAQKISRRNITNKNLKNKLQIFTTGDAKKFQSKLEKIGIKNKVTLFSC